MRDCACAERLEDVPTHKNVSRIIVPIVLIVRHEFLLHVPATRLHTTPTPCVIASL
jgi:hypothetical protein